MRDKINNKIVNIIILFICLFTILGIVGFVGYLYSPSEIVIKNIFKKIHNTTKKISDLDGVK